MRVAAHSWRGLVTIKNGCPPLQRIRESYLAQDTFSNKTNNRLFCSLLDQHKQEKEFPSFQVIEESRSINRPYLSPRSATSLRAEAKMEIAFFVRQQHWKAIFGGKMEA